MSVYYPSILFDPEPSDELKSVAGYWSDWDLISERDVANLCFLTEKHGTEGDLYGTNWDKRIAGGVNSPEFEAMMEEAETTEVNNDTSYLKIAMGKTDIKVPGVLQGLSIDHVVESYEPNVEMNENVDEALDRARDYLETYDVLQEEDIDLKNLRKEVRRTPEFEEMTVDFARTG